MPSRCDRYFLVVLMLLAQACFLALSPMAHGQLWKHFVPASRSKAATQADFGLTENNGPWLIVAATFSGDGAEDQAHELAQEFRERYRLRAYLHEMSFDFSGDSRGRGVDEYGAPLRGRYRRGDKVQELAVLIGDFSSIDAPEAQQTLEHVKTMEPNALQVEADRTAQSLAQIREWQDQLLQKVGKKRDRGPMGQAFLTRNPLLPREYFVPKGVDSFVAKMNEGLEHTLLDCPGKYTVQVATFRGKTVLQTSGTDIEAPRSPWAWKKDRNPLMEAGENAHALTAVLRAHGWEAYEFHDRTESIVTIGSFDQAAQQLPDGRLVPAPGLQRIIETFGAAYDTPSDPLTDIGNDPTTQRRVAQEQQQFNIQLTSQQSPIVPGMNPKHVKILKGSGKQRRVEKVIPMDIHPQAIEAPKRSVSSVYAGG